MSSKSDKEPVVKFSNEGFEKALLEQKGDRYVLKLYVAGMSTKSLQAIENLKRICEENLPGKYELDIIDIYQQPIIAKDGRILAAPTLIKELPPPLKKLVGSMSNAERVLVGLDIRQKKK